MLENRIRRIAPALAAAVACSAVVAGTASAQTAKFKPSSLSGEFHLVSHSATKAGLTVLIHNFNVSYPHIKVDVQYFPPGPTFSQALLSMVNSGNAPDVMFTNPNPSSDVPAPVLGKAGKLLDLSKQPFAKRIPKADRSLFFYKGKVYAEPIFKVASGINYNVTEFKKRGWAPPKTFKQLLGLCAKAKASGINLLAFADQSTAEAVNSVSASTVFSKDPDWIQKRIQGKVKFATSPLWKDMYQHFIQMRDADCFQPGWQAAGFQDTTPLLASGKALMFMAPSQGLSSLEAARPDEQWASMPFPGDTAAQTRAMLGYNFGLSVSASSPNKKVALAFIDFAGREGQSRLFAKLNGSISLHDVNVGNFPPTMAAYAPFVKAGKVVARPDSQWPTSTTTNDINTVTGAILAGGKNITDALGLLDQRFGR